MSLSLIPWPDLREYYIPLYLISFYFNVVVLEGTV